MQTEGYLTVDHRFSPGIPEEMALAMGFDPKMVGAGKFMEAATLSCQHCKGVVVKNPLRVRERSYCMQCRSYICDACKAATLEPNFSHLNYDQRVEVTRELADKGIDISGSSLILT